MTTTQTGLRPTQQLLADAMKKYAIQEKTDGSLYTFVSGRTSNWYSDGRQLTFRGDCVELVGHSIMEALEAAEKEMGKEPGSLTGFDAVGGPAVGAVPIAVAVGFVTGKNSFAVRKEAKDHGVGNLIAGPLEPGQKVLLVEDNATTGGSVLRAVDAAQEFGCEVVAVVTLLDRTGEAGPKCEERGLVFVPVLGAPDVGYEYGS
ncbi:MAG TPA: phosphoribosyltransferase family protein [Acidimicrobiia bacterium]|nr:phosphoribosyltransferase family protein [Acidimicrobiia bacterium]